MPLPKWLPSGGVQKPLVPIIAVVGGISLTLMILSQRQTMRSLEGQLQLSRQHVTQLEGQNEQLTQQVSALESDRQGLDARVKSLRSELASAATNLDQSRASLTELQARVAKLQEQNTALEGQMSGVSRERDEARVRATALVEEKSDLERSLLRLRERLTLLDRDYRELTEQLAKAQAAPSQVLSAVIAVGPKNHAGSYAPVVTALAPGTVELPPIVVRKDAAGMSMPVRGRIVEVNEPHGFIVVDKGSMDGVHVGMSFDIVRGASTIGRAAVVRVRPQLSACDILRAKTSGPLQAGDQAVQSGTSAR